MAKLDLNLKYGYTAHRFDQQTIRAAVTQPSSMRLLQIAFHWLNWCLRKDLTLTWRSESRN